LLSKTPNTPYFVSALPRKMFCSTVSCGARTCSW
jgi:hypothetical protein